MVADAVSLGRGSVNPPLKAQAPPGPSRRGNRERPVRSNRKWGLRKPRNDTRRAAPRKRKRSAASQPFPLASHGHVALHHARRLATSSAPSATPRRGRCRFWRTRRRHIIDGHECAHTALAPRDRTCSALWRLEAVLGHPRAEPAREVAELRPRQRVQLLAVDARWPQRHGRASSRAMASRVLGPTTPSTTRP